MHRAPDFSVLSRLRGLWRQHPRYRGIVGHWLLNERAGGTVRSVAGPQFPGTLEGTTPPAWEIGLNGPALDFDGSTSLVNMGDLAAMNFTGFEPHSASVWANLNTGESGKHFILGKQSNVSSDRYRGWNMLNDSPSRFEVTFNYDFSPSDGISVYGTTSLIGAGWKHLAFTYDGSGDASGLNLYINGIAESTTVDRNNLTTSIANIRNFTLGARTNQLYWGGKLQDARVYARQLAPGEVMSLYADPFLEFKWAQQQVQNQLFRALGGRIMSSLVGHGGLVAEGGLAGRGGGLAA